MALYIGIDPGKSGCLAIINRDSFRTDVNGEQIVFFDWPKDGDLGQYCQQLQSIPKKEVKLAVLERVHAMPKQGVTSMFSFGMNFGIWQGLLTALDWPFILVPPQTWMKNLVSKADGSDTKTRVRNVAQRLYPKSKEALVGPKGGFKDGRADALLMARYAMLQSK